MSLPRCAVERRTEDVYTAASGSHRTVSAVSDLKPGVRQAKPGAFVRNMNGAKCQLFWVGIGAAGSSPDVGKYDLRL